jgi:hypothetical protein
MKHLGCGNIVHNRESSEEEKEKKKIFLPSPTPKYFHPKATA